MTKTTTIKVLAIAILHFSFSIFNSAAQAAVIDQVIVRQQWPWSTDVKIEYRLSGVTSPVDISVTAYNGTNKLDNSNIDGALTGSRYGVTDSVGTIILDPVKAFGGTKVAIADFRVELELSDSAANVNEVLYKIFCLTNSNEEVVNVTRAELLNGKYGSYITDFSSLGRGFNSPATDVLIWTGVTNDVRYATTHLVMRKIAAKNVTWSMGAYDTDVAYGKATSGLRHNVTLDNDYFIGVFPVTQRQYVLMTSFDNPSYFKNLEDSDMRPVETRKYATIISAVLPKVREATGIAAFTLPTEAQWEFACRAGTTSELNSGKTLTVANAKEVAWCSDNANGETHPVGLLAPNAYGLYDMHGNVGEGCLDWYSTTEPGYGDGVAVSNPTGPATDPGGAGEHITRGGYYTLPGSTYMIGSPGRGKHNGEYRTYGFRLAFTCE